MYRLVIVDDEQEIRKGICTYFPWNDIGFAVAADFCSAQEADEYIQSHPIDVLVTDIRMRGMSGIELIEGIYKRGQRMQFVVISGHKDFEYARRVMKMGVRHYLVKPMKFAQIVEVFSEIRKELDALYEEELPDKTEQETKKQAEEGNEVIRRVKAYIHEHYEDATLEQAAARVRMNPYYLSSYFHQQTGEKFSDYLQRARMKEAARLLAGSELRIQEVSMRVGYTTANSFSRSFKQCYRMTPKEYRLRNGGGKP